MESECEIEYLDEDADIVQQLVQGPVPVAQPTVKDEPKTPLLVERKNEKKRKRKKEPSDDSDYDPAEDIQHANIAINKKRKNTLKKSSSVTKSAVQIKSVELPKSSPKSRTTEVFNRKKLDIRIPDYEDPLCLPVRAIKSVGSDVNRLKKWNIACIEHLRQSDTLLTPENGETESSSRTIVLSNVTNKESGRIDTAVWSKTCVVNKEGVKKSEIFQCMLPKYREKNVLKPIKFNSYRKKHINHINEVILTKEDHKNEETLVAYNPYDTLSAVYKFAQDEKSFRDLLNDDDEQDSRRVVREVGSCRVCVPCYQTSWRGPTDKNEKRKLECPICGRSTISLYNLLTHVRAHNAHDVRKHREELSEILAKVVEYHYRCRVCNEKFQSIGALRKHVAIHKGTAVFKCEVGNHMTT